MNPSARFIPGLMALLLVLALSGCGKSPEEHYQAGRALLEKNDYKAAIVEFKSALQEQPGNREARLMLGKAYLAGDAYADAEKELSKAREQGASNDETLPALAKAYLKTAQAQKLLDLTIPGSSLSPRSIASLQVSRAAAFMSLDKRKEAEAALQIANAADAEFPDALLFSAKLALFDKNKAEALRLIEVALHKDPKFVDALYMKAALLLQDSKVEEATQIFQQIIANDARQVRALVALTDIYLRSGKLDAAEKSLQSAEKEAAAAPLVKFQRGMLELEHGKLLEAKTALDQVLRVMPDYQPAILALASVNYGLGNIENSLRLALKALGSDPKNILATRLVAGSQFKSGDANAALLTLTPLLKSGVEDVQVFNLAAEIYTQRKEFNKAMEFIDRALALNPNSSALITQQAINYLYQGDEKLAMAKLEKAASLNVKPGKADFGLFSLQMQRKQFDAAMQTIAEIDKKLPNTPISHNLRAAVLMARQDQTGARKELEQALSIQPTFIPAAMGLARMDIIDNNIPAARKRFESVLAKDQNNLMAMLAMADLAKAGKQENEYVKWLERAVKAHPEAIKPTEHLVRYYLEKKENAKALVMARDVLKSNPDSPDAMRLLGSVQASTGAISDSITSFNSLVEKNSKSPAAYLQLAGVQIADKRYQQARTNLARALQIKPDFVAAKDALIRLELMEKNPDAALQLAHQMQQQNPKSVIGFDREGDIHLFQKHYSQAVKAYDAALSRADSSQGFIKLHQALMLEGDSPGADKRLGVWLASHPQDNVVRQYAAQMFLNANRNKEAIVQYELILKTSPKNVLALNNLADLYQKEKDTRAMVTAEQAFKLAPDNPGIMDTLGWILVEAGQIPRGTDLLRKAVEKMPKVGVLRYHLGVALSKSGEKAKAKTELEAAIATGQKFPELEKAKTLLITL